MVRVVMMNCVGIVLRFFFFLTSNSHFITQTWGDMGNQTWIKQPIKNNFLWKDLAVLAKKSEIWNLISLQSLAKHEAP